MAKGVVGFLLGLAVASGIWGVIFVKDLFAFMLIPSGLLIVILCTAHIVDNWDK